MARFALLSISVLFFVLSGCFQGEFRFDSRWEVGEPPDFDQLRGQKTCILEGWMNEPTPSCPLELTGVSYPKEGILVLDSFYTTLGPPDDSRAASALVNYTVNYLLYRDPSGGSIFVAPYDTLAGSNPHRYSEGFLPDLILPGPGTFVAALGWWENLDGDTTARFSVSTNFAPVPGTEWAQKPKSKVYSWVEPGTYPASTSLFRGGSTLPDFVYRPETHVYVAGGNTIDFHLFSTGSLLEPLSVYTVSDPVLVPSEEGRPFVPTFESRIDYDEYASIAPAPLSDLYTSSLAPFFEEYGALSLSTCPSSCTLPPSLGVGIVDDSLEDLFRAIWRRYPSEVLESSGSSLSARGAEAQSSWVAILDVVPGMRIPGPQQYITRLPNYLQPLPSDPQGGITAPPGVFSVEVWTGVWKDLSGDGYVGSGDPRDSRGSRAFGNDFLHPDGEFVGAWPKGGESFFVKLVPFESWAPGVFLLNNLGYTSTGDSCATTVAGFCVPPGYSGNTPLSILMQRDTAMGTDGHWISFHSLLLPFGSPGFWACLGSPNSPLFLEFSQAGIDVFEPVFDCDRIEPFRG